MTVAARRARHFVLAVVATVGVYDTVVGAWMLGAGARLGAFSTCLGLTTPVAGVGFGSADQAFFVGTPYLVVKRVIGRLWLLRLSAGHAAAAYRASAHAGKYTGYRR